MAVPARSWTNVGVEGGGSPVDNRAMAIAVLQVRRAVSAVLVLLAAVVLSLSAGAAVAGAETANTCVVKSDGTVWCWGLGEVGQLGNGLAAFGSATPVQVVGVTGAVEVATGTSNGCALLEAGTVSCWGGTYVGVLALDDLGTSESPPQRVGAARVIAGVDGAQSISVGQNGACVVREDGKVVCWGCDKEGLSGQGVRGSCDTWNYEPDGLFRPSVVPGIDGAVSVSVGQQHACAVIGDGSVKCWGTDGGMGRIGAEVPESGAPVSPRTVAGVAVATAVSVNGYMSCAIVAGGAVSCWGRPSGWFSDDPGTHNAALVDGISGALDLKLDDGRACVILSDRKVKCWGWVVPDMTRLPDSGSPTPVLIPGVAGAAKLTGSTFAPCVVRANGTVACWGNDFGGAAGSGRPIVDTLYDVGGRVLGLDDSTAVTVGSYFGCGLRQSGGGVACIGLGPFRTEPDPGEWSPSESKRGLTLAQEAWQVPGSEGASSVDAGGTVGCAVIGGLVKCLGKPSSEGGSLGGGDGVGDSLFVPVTVTGISDATAVSVGSRAACAIHQAGAVSCWGQVWDTGSGYTTLDNDARAVTGLSDAVQVSAGAGFGCAVRAGGQVACWGDNYNKVFGTGSPNGSAGAVDVDGVEDAVKVRTSNDAACALIGDGTVTCWGEGMTDTLGYGSFQAAQFDGVEDADDVAIDADSDSVCWVREGGVWCRGLLGLVIHAMNGEINFATGDLDEGIDPDAPVAVPGVENATAVDLSGMAGCLRLTDGGMRCFGMSYFGLGDGRLPTGHGPAVVPLTVSGLSGVRTGLPSGDDSPVDEPEPVTDPGTVADIDPAEGGFVLPPLPVVPGVPVLPSPGAQLSAAPAVLRANQLVLTRFAVRRAGARCPGRVSARISVGSRTRTLTTSRVERRGRYCVLTVSLALPKAATKAKNVRFKVRGKGVKTRVVRVKRR